jgi:hypothetical protein
MHGNHFYVTLFSNDSQSLYPTNTLASFTSRLAKPLELVDDWEVAIMEFTHPPNISGQYSTIPIYIGIEHKFIYCDIISPQFIGGNLVRCIRSYIPSEINGQYKFDPIYYMPVERRYIRDIRIQINSIKGEIHKFRDNVNPVKVILHFRCVRKL